MKTSLHLKQSTNLTLTPQLQQSIKLLQLSTIELNQEITVSVLADADTSNMDERFTYSIGTRSGEQEKRGGCSTTESIQTSQWLWLSLLVYGRRRWMHSSSTQ